MKRLNHLLIGALAAMMLACGTTSQVPITGRKHSLLVSDAQILSLSKQEYAKFLSSARLSSNAANTAMVKRVGQRLARAVETYLVNNGYQDEIKNFEWEFNLVADNHVNAFCMPGGKIVVYTGLLNLVGNGSHSDDELAAVMGHELSHALAKHANERISNQMLMQAGGQLLGATVGSRSGMLSGILNQAYGLGAQVGVLLPFGRKQEYEADKMGLVLMAIAGYDPRYAVNFWQKMAQSKGGGQQSELLSTHPSDANRIKAIEAYLPTALQYYKGQGSAPASSYSGSSSQSRRQSNARSVRANDVANYLNNR